MQDVPSVRFLDRQSPPHIATLVIASGLAAATMNLYLPSLPGMAAHFDVDYHLVQLTVTIFLATNAVMQLIIGPLSDRLGRRPVLLGACAIFILASIAMVFAPTIGVLLALRMVQAVMVTGLVLSRAIVRDMFPADKAASQIGYVTMGMAIVPMLAPMLGGVIDASFGWKGNFWFLTLAGLAVFWLIWRDLGETATLSDEGILDQFRDVPELFTSRRFWGYCLSVTFISGGFFSYLGGRPSSGQPISGSTRSGWALLWARLRSVT